MLTPDGFMLIGYCLLLSAHWLLPDASCICLIAYCVPPLAYCSLLTAYCLHLDAYCCLLIAYCLLLPAGGKLVDTSCYFLLLPGTYDYYFYYCPTHPHLGLPDYLDNLNLIT